VTELKPMLYPQEVQYELFHFIYVKSRCQHVSIDYGR